MQFYVDAPTSWHLPSRFVIVRGWCYADDCQASASPRRVPGPASGFQPRNADGVRRGRPIRGIRLSLPGFAVHGAVGLPRPDVMGAIPDAPDDSTGFEIRALLPPGHAHLRLEAQAPDGDWVPLVHLNSQTPRRPRLGWLAGGRTSELVAYQAPTFPQHAPRPIRYERFPRTKRSGRPLPSIAIVTPSYGHSDFLESCLASVVNQPDADFQYVVQDGGSTDGSVEIIRRHADRLHAWESAPDQGQADAIARGFAKTTGRPEDLMAWLNSDDFYLPGALRFVADYFARHPDVDVVYGHRIVMDEHSQEIARWFLPRHDPEVLRLNDFVPQETLFWRRHLWDRVGGVDTSLQFAIDWDLLLRFQAAGAKIVRLPYFLGCFRVHARQKTTAAMQTVGQKEIGRLRRCEHGRDITPAELETHPRLLRHLRRSALVALLWKLGLRT